MTPFEFHVPTKILFSPRIVQNIADEVRVFSRKAILVTMTDLPFVGRVVDILESGGVAWGSWSGSFAS